MRQEIAGAFRSKKSSVCVLYLSATQRLFLLSVHSKLTSGRPSLSPLTHIENVSPLQNRVSVFRFFHHKFSCVCNRNDGAHLVMNTPSLSTRHSSYKPFGVSQLFGDRSQTQFVRLFRCRPVPFVMTWSSTQSTLLMGTTAGSLTFKTPHITAASHASCY